MKQHLYSRAQTARSRRGGNPPSTVGHTTNRHDRLRTQTRGLEIVKSHDPQILDFMKVKCVALNPCKRLELTKLEQNMRKSRTGNLDVFFAVKIHKLGAPLRSIVTERGSWQRLFSLSLQKHFSDLKLSDPFLMRSSQCIVDIFSKESYVDSLGLSIGVDVLFYSIPCCAMIVLVRECIERNDTIAFQNARGVFLGGFL
uniref:Putative tick transposon n=1 Tax=Ixodes ricinus TaxID=34613 RepID=A0A6B0V1U6_IXORI